MVLSATAPTVHVTNDDLERDPLARAFGETLEFGDIVSCRFPRNERPNLPGPKRRPGCVLDTRRQNGQLYLVVAYCTGVRLDDAQADELTITDPEALSRAGLHRPTRLVVSRARTLPFTYDFFMPNKDGTVVLGRLSDPCRARVAQINGALASGQRDMKHRGPAPREVRRHGRRSVGSSPVSPAL